MKQRTDHQGNGETYDPVPYHLAIIMDGNSRWAAQHGLSVAKGHRAGAKNVRPIAEHCADLGVKQLTLFAFSTENWNRPRKEVNLLIELIGETLRNDVDDLIERATRLRFIGDRTRFPSDIQKQMYESEARTREKSSMVLTIALNYGGRWDIAHAMREISQAILRREFAPSEIDEDLIAAHLSTAGLTSPDLCIRTGGDRRLSNFLLWDLAYTEFVFTERYWPEFEYNDLLCAFGDYESRERRYGARDTYALDHAPI